MSAGTSEPYELWKQAEAEFPDDETRRAAAYRDAMVEAGYLIPRQSTSPGAGDE